MNNNFSIQLSTTSSTFIHEFEASKIYDIYEY
jgi:hypothetical protein